MTGKTEHPEDFSAYLGRSSSEKEYEEIRSHLESCPGCRDEMRSWQALDGLFRSPDLEIEVPPHQWQRIKARLKSPRVEKDWMPQLAFLMRPGRLAYGLTFVMLLLFGAAFFGWEYRRHLVQEDFLAIAAYSESERVRLGQAENPFKSFAASPSQDNPFARFQTPDEGNPFAVR